MTLESLLLPNGVILPLSEIEFRTSRSSGKGGQHLNKVETKVELLFNIAQTNVFTPEQKAQLLSRLKHRVNRDGVLSITVQEYRSQWQNKQRALEKLGVLLHRALQDPKRRLPTHPTLTAHERRLGEKRKRSELKVSRRKNYYD